MSNYKVYYDDLPKPPFNVEVEWREYKDYASPLGEVSFPFYADRKGTLSIDEATLQHPYFLGQPLDVIVKHGIEQNCIKEGVCDRITVTKYIILK